ncbi:MAG TPA: transcriptional regulator GcvA [Beijerinckiaceae bacterium]|jgi:LysR family glycine cleavage system transcriptional activator
MKRRLPPLNAVRAFEAAARHLSFLKAADELSVTPGAVAQHVKGLEAWLGATLFRRLPSKGVRLTEVGRDYASSLGEVLDDLADATARARRRGSSERGLTVTTVPSFAARWLIPRLGSFRERQPGVEVRILAAVGLADLSREDVDVAVRLGPGPYPGLRADLLIHEVFFPVCSPALLERGPPLKVLDDLQRHTLLHEDPDPGIPAYVYWPQWLAAVGAKQVDATHGPRFSHTFMALQAAVGGQGVALATNVAIGDDLTTGRLVRPFPGLDLPGPYAHHLVTLPERADEPAIRAFREWALEEAAATAAS